MKALLCNITCLMHLFTFDKKFHLCEGGDVKAVFYFSLLAKYKLMNNSIFRKSKWAERGFDH